MNVCKNKINTVYGRFAQATSLLVFVFFTQVAFASNVGPIPDTNTLLQGARLVFDQAPQQQNYRLVLSGVKKVNGAWRSEVDEQLDAMVSRRTYELDKSMRLRDVRALLNRVTRFSGRLKNLFTCDGADCGSSNAWANHFFEIKQLYGTNLSQHYSVWEALDGQTQRIILVYYLVERGNGDIMLQEDLLKLNKIPSSNVPLAASALADQLFQARRIVAPGFRLNTDEPVLDANAMSSLANMLQINESWSVYVVGHDAGPGSLVQQKTRALRYANMVADRLKAMGVAEDRLIVLSVGGLVPLASEPTARVELVLRLD